MSQENIEVVRQLFVAMDQRDDAAIFGRYHPDIAWHDHGAWFDISDDYRGFDGIRAAWRPFLREFEHASFEARDLVDVGDQVVVTVHVTARGRASGLISEREVSMVWLLRDAKVAQVDVYAGRDEALVAAEARHRRATRKS